VSFYKLVWRNLAEHKLRSLLTIGGLVVALFLLCILRSLVTTMERVTTSGSTTRLVVQSAVSLFVDLPTSYQQKVEAVPGVDLTCKLQWFGGYYREPSNFFAQFAVDPPVVFDMYPELVIVEGSRQAFESKRTACLIGAGLARSFGWKIGDTLPLIGALFPHPDGGAWEFEVAAIYRPGAPNWNDRTMFFHWDYFEKTLEQSPTGAPGMGTLILHTAPGADREQIMATVDALFVNGPQRVQTTTESEFQAQFASMVGNVPLFVGSIGGGVLVAILLACMNTMLMAGLEQTRAVGLLKALGFGGRAAFMLMVLQSLFLCLLGGGAGIALAILLEPFIAERLGPNFPGFAITPGTHALGLGVSILVGLVAGFLPARNALRLRPVDALRTEE